MSSPSRPTPLQNRVTPWGEIIAHPARGLFVGNRGILVDRAHELGRRRWALKAWLICTLEFQGRWRPVMQPRTWTELFFFDEAVALAAGHRPCATCRRSAYRSFRDAAAAEMDHATLRAPEMDAHLHSERLMPRSHDKRLHHGRFEDLVDGAFVLLSADDVGVGAVLGDSSATESWTTAGEVAALVWQDALFPWSPLGYGAAIERPSAGEVRVLTPPLTMGVLRRGYVPRIHSSAAI